MRGLLQAALAGLSAAPAETNVAEVEQTETDPFIEMAALLADPPSWIHRRVESLQFQADGSTRRHVSVDLTLPAPFVTNRFVPIALLSKGILRAFDARDASGSSVSVFTTDEGIEASYGVLESYVRPECRDSARDVISEILQFRPGDPHYTAEGGNALLARFRSIQLCDGEEGVRLAEQLLGGFLLFVKLDDAVVASDRIVLKFSYEAEELGNPLYEGGWLMRVIRAHVMRWGTPRDLATAVDVQWAERYHFEVRAPRSLLVRSLSIEYNAGGATFLVAGSDEAGRSGRRIEQVALDGSPDADPHDGVINIVPDRGGLPRVASYAAWLTFCVILVPLLINRFWPDVVAVPTDGTASALLLLGPALLAAFIATGPDHSLAAQRLKGARATMSAVGLILFLAALAAGGVVSPEWRTRVWWVCLGVAAVVTALQTMWFWRATAKSR